MYTQSVPKALSGFEWHWLGMLIITIKSQTACKPNKLNIQEAKEMKKLSKAESSLKNSRRIKSVIIVTGNNCIHQDSHVKIMNQELWQSLPMAEFPAK